jgi:hypothetical protein
MKTERGGPGAIGIAEDSTLALGFSLCRCLCIAYSSGPCGLQTVLTTNLVANANYWLTIDGFSSQSGAYTVVTTCPSTTVQPVIRGNVACNSLVAGNTAGGTHTVGHAAPENWWRFVAPVSGMYTFNTCGSSYDTW